MTNEELAVRVKNGEEWAILELWQSVVNYVYKRARRYERESLLIATRAEHEDLVQDGFIAMLDAAEAFEPDRGKTFIGFLEWELQKKFAEEAGVRSSKRDSLLFADSVDEPLARDGSEGDTLLDLTQDPEWEYAFCIVDYFDFLRYVRRLIDVAMRSITPHQRDCIEKYFYEEMTLDEIAGEGHSREGPRAAIEKGLKYLRRGKYHRELKAALIGFSDFDLLRKEGHNGFELKALSRNGIKRKKK